MNIEIHTYDESWPVLFMQTAKPLRDGLSVRALRIDHIGSTSIPGAAAKPIIDIQISVQSIKEIESIVPVMEKLGYMWRSDNPDLTKRYFREKPGAQRTHIHIRRMGSWSEQLALLFRDYMRCHPVDVQEYVDLKYQLAQEFSDNRQAYTDAKSPFIWQVMQKADRWSQSCGWYPAPSDV